MRLLKLSILWYMFVGLELVVFASQVEVNDEKLVCQQENLSTFALYKAFDEYVQAIRLTVLKNYDSCVGWNDEINLRRIPYEKALPYVQRCLKQVSSTHQMPTNEEEEEQFLLVWLFLQFNVVPMTLVRVPLLTWQLIVGTSIYPFPSNQQSCPMRKSLIVKLNLLICEACNKCGQDMLYRDGADILITLCDKMHGILNSVINFLEHCEEWKFVMDGVEQDCQFCMDVWQTLKMTDPWTKAKEKLYDNEIEIPSIDIARIRERAERLSI